MTDRPPCSTDAMHYTLLWHFTLCDHCSAGAVDEDHAALRLCDIGGHLWDQLLTRKVTPGGRLSLRPRPRRGKP